MTELSVILVSSGTRELLRSCLEGLKTSLPLSSEVIVVDNGSQDGSPRMVQEGYGHVRLIRNARDIGEAHAKNQGVDRARGAYVLFLALDTGLSASAARLMLAFLEENVRFGAVAPRLVGSDGTTIASHRRFPRPATALACGTPYERWFPENGELRRQLACDFDYERDGEVELPSPACLLMRRKALKKQRPFDEGLRAGFSEADLCKRLAKAGWKIGYLSGAHVYHHEVLAPAVPLDDDPEWHADSLQYYRKHHGRLGAAVVKTAVAWNFVDRGAHEVWRRAHGEVDVPLAPEWNALTALMRR